MKWKYGKCDQETQRLYRLAFSNALTSTCPEVCKGTPLFKPIRSKTNAGLKHSKLKSGT